MNAIELAKPDNEADCTILLSISGNRLVSVLNALDGALHENGRYRFEGDTVKGSSSWYDALRATTESIRDELSRQRCKTNLTHERVYAFDLVETAIALYSALDEYNLLAFDGLPVDHPAKPSEISARNARENMGAAESRRVCVELSAICEATWLALSLEERDVITWDFEFCPAFLLYCVNWHDIPETVAANPVDLAQRRRDGSAAHEAYKANCNADELDALNT